MSSSIQPSSINAGGRTVAQGADAEDKLVLVLTGGLVIGVGVVGSEGRVVKGHGEGGLKAAEAGRGRTLQESLYCTLSLTLMINALLRIQVKGCRRNDSQTQQSDSHAHVSCDAIVLGCSCINQRTEPECRLHYLASALGPRSYERLARKGNSSKTGR